MSPALINSFKVWSLLIFQFSHIWHFEIRQLNLLRVAEIIF
jgi:hypothetical protein